MKSYDDTSWMDDVIHEPPRRRKGMLSGTAIFVTLVVLAAIIGTLIAVVTL